MSILICRPTQIKSGGVGISNSERMGWREAGVWEQSEGRGNCDKNTLYKSMIFSKIKIILFGKNLVTAFLNNIYFS